MIMLMYLSEHFEHVISFTAHVFFLICEELLPGIFHRVYVGLQAGSAEAEMRVKHLLKDIRLKNC